MNRSRTISIVGWLSLAFVVITMGCTNDRTGGSEITTASPTPVAGASPMSPGQTTRVADVTGNPNNYIGQTVTVVSDVDQVRGGHMFKLDDEAPMAGGIDNDLWVLSPQADNLANLDNQWLNNRVRVTGVVRRFMANDIEREIGWNLDQSMRTDLENAKVVLIANSIERVQ